MSASGLFDDIAITIIYVQSLNIILYDPTSSGATG